MKKLRKMWSYAMHHKKISLAVIILIGVIGYFLIPKSTNTVETVKAKKEKIVQTISASGTIDSATIVTLNFLSGGKLVYVGAKKGDKLEAGQTIAVLDQRSLKKNLEQILRDYSKQRNSFEATQDTYADRRPDQALNDTMKRILENNQYDLEKAIGSVELQQLSLEQSVLATPIKGILVRADAPVAGVNIGAATTYVVADPEAIVFKIDVDESDISKVTLGMPVEISLDAFPDKKFTLPVTNIDFASHKSDTGGTVYTVEVNLPQTVDYQYRLGMSGDAQIITNQRLDVLVIPLSSLEGEKYVYKKKDKSFERISVKTGLTNDTSVEILQGLEPGDEVALDPEAAKKTLPK